MSTISYCEFVVLFLLYRCDNQPGVIEWKEPPRRETSFGTKEPYVTQKPGKGQNLYHMKNDSFR